MDDDTRNAALDALAHGLRGLDAAIAEAQSSFALNPSAVRRLKERGDRWRTAHSALSREVPDAEAARLRTEIEELRAQIEEDRADAEAASSERDAHED